MLQLFDFEKLLILEVWKSNCAPTECALPTIHFFSKPSIVSTCTWKDIGRTLLHFSMCTLEVDPHTICIEIYLGMQATWGWTLELDLRSSEKLISYPCRWNYMYIVAFKRYIDGRPNLCRWRGNRFSNFRKWYFSKIAKLPTRTN